MSLSLFFKIVGGFLLALALILIGGEPSIETVQAGHRWDAFMWGGIIALAGLGSLWLSGLVQKEDKFFQ